MTIRTRRKIAARAIQAANKARRTHRRSDYLYRAAVYEVGAVLMMANIRRGYTYRDCQREALGV